MPAEKASIKGGSDSKRKILFTTSILGSPWHKEFAPYSKSLLGAMRRHSDVLLIRPVNLLDKLKKPLQAQEWSTEDAFPTCLTIPKLYSINLKLRQQAIEQTLTRHSFSPDAIYATWAFPDAVVASRIAKKRNIPYVVRVHGTDINYLATLPNIKEAVGEALVGAKAVICPSEDLRLKVDQITQDQSNSITMINPVSPVVNGGSDTDSIPMVIYVGNLKSSKGVLDLLAAFRQVSSQVPEAILHYVGSGSEERRLKSLVVEQQMSDRVVFHGHLPHQGCKEMIAKSRVLCLPSYSEGLPNVILEGLAANIEIVATDVGGISEVVSFQNGALVTPGCIQSIARELLNALTDPSRRTLAINPPMNDTDYATAVLSMLD